MDSTRYAQAVARLSVMETKLLDKAKIDRMVESSSAEEALKVLQETQYGNHMGSVRRPEDYEILLSDELKRLYSLMYEVSPNKLLIDIFSIRYDYHNIKVMLKGKALNKDLNYLLIPVGTIPLEKLKQYSIEEDYRDLNKYMREAFEIGEKSFKVDKNPQKIDVITDNLMYKDMLSKANSLNEKFIIDYIEMMIDLTNVRTLFRIKKQNKGRDFLNNVLIEGGRIDKDVFINNMNDSVENFVNKISYTDYYGVLKMGVEEYVKSGKLNELEKLSDNFLLEYVKKARYMSFGVEPLLAYIYAKENEIKAIRIVMVGKLNKISSEVIRERLRDIYV